MAGPPFFNPIMFSTELIFTLISVVFCFAIYFKTKEIYELTKYKGINYFRQAFLLFGLSYVLRFVFSILLFSSIAFDIFFPMRIMRIYTPLFILPLGYFSTAAILLLIFSLIWKKVNNERMVIIGHIIALMTSLIAFLTRSPQLLSYLQTGLLIAFIIILALLHKEEKKLTKTRILYVLVLLLWLINLLVIDTRRPLPFGIESSFRIASLVVFVIIYYRISRWVK